MRESELKSLDEACEKCMEENGTLNTEFLKRDYWIEKQAERCRQAGATREEVNMIFAKYGEGIGHLNN